MASLAQFLAKFFKLICFFAQDVKTPVKTSMVSLGVAAVLYLALFPLFGYLAVPIGIVISGYLKNFLLARACRKSGLINHDKRTLKVIFLMGGWAIFLGAGLYLLPITNIIALVGAIVVYAVLYLPVAYVIDRKI